MMRRLYRLLLQLYPRHIRAEYTAEMLAVFDEAEAAERRRGPSAYARFCAREIAGLLTNLVAPEGFMRHKRFVLYGGIAGLVIGTAVGAAWSARPYTSVALLRALPQMIPERFVSVQVVPVDRRLRRIAQTILSRGNLTNMVAKFELYPAERRRMPLEDVIEIMKKAVSITPGDGDTISVSFSYSDPAAAQKVTNDIVSRIMAEHVRDRTLIALQTVQFMKDAVQDAARELDSKLAALRLAEEKRQPIERNKLDADIARQRYESLSAKLAEADIAEQMEKRQQGPILEVLDPASLPSELRPSVMIVALAGLGVGAILGLLLSWIFPPRVRPAVAEA